MKAFVLRLLMIAWYVFLLPYFLLYPIIWAFTGFGSVDYEDALERAIDELERTKENP